MSVNLNAEGLAVGNAWHPEAAVEYNRITGTKGIPERFRKNIVFILRQRGLESLEEQAAELMKLTNLSRLYVEHILLGVGTFTHAAIICTKLEVGLGTMLEVDIEEGDVSILPRIQQKTA